MDKIKDILYKSIQSYLTLIKVVIKYRLLRPMNKLVEEKDKKTCVIIGNGPSLKSEMLVNSKLFTDNFTICVNYFPLSDEYIKIKPNAIVLHAYEFWLDNVKNEYLISRAVLFEKIISNTSWNLIIYAPVKAKSSTKIIKILKSNNNIDIAFYNDTPVEGFQFFNNFLIKNGFGMPRPHNVIIPSLVVAIRHCFEIIYLTGVDHSWLKEISVDENNNVLVGQYHFYDSDNIKPAPMNKLGRLKTRNLAEVLDKFLLTFKSYYILHDLAVARNVRILNLTKESFIDAFEREDINKL